MRKPINAIPSTAVNIVLILTVLMAVSSGIFLIFAQSDSFPQKTTENSGASLPLSGTLPYREEVKTVSMKYGIDEARIYAVILTESSFRPEVISSAGAVGLMQMLPATYEEMCLARGVAFNPQDLKDPATNLDFCCEYLLLLYNLTGSWDLAHLAYHAGIGNVQKWLANPEYSADGKTIDRIPSSASAKYLERINAARNAYRTVLEAEKKASAAE